MKALLLSFALFPALFVPVAEAATKTVPFVNEIKDAKTFESLGKDPGGVVRTGQVIKFLIDNRTYPNGKVYFINGNHCEGSDCPTPVKWVALHYDFAVKKLPNFNVEKRAFEDSVYYKADAKDKKFVAGRIQTFEFEKDGKKESFYGVWFFERDIIHEESIQYVVELIKNAMPIAEAKFGFVQYSTEQTVNNVRPWFESNNIGIYTVEQLFRNVTILPLNPGDRCGFLRVSPKDPDDLEPTDIPLFDQLPLDLAVVAGTISTAFQDSGSHVNLKSKERGTPNVVVRRMEDLERIKAMDGQPIRLKVTDEDYLVEPATEKCVYDQYNKVINRPWQNPTQELKGEPLAYDDMCRGKKPAVCLGLGVRYGGKASRVGFLAHEKVIGDGSPIRTKFNYRLTPLGFGVPLRFYKEFVDYNYEKNPEFKADLEKLIQTETGENGLLPLPTPEKKALIEKVRNNFLNAQFPQALYESLEKHVAAMREKANATYPGEDLNKIKIRSSANVEDIDGFNGAGLHDSYSARIKKSNFENANQPCKIIPDADSEEGGETKMDVEPHTLGCAIKGVYASLWNLRAVRERSYRRFNHRTATMGLAIMPAYKFRTKVEPEPDISANAVLITRVLNADAVYGYQMSTQKGNVLVTNPPPGTQAELATLVYQLRSVPAITILRYAKPKSSEPEMTEKVLDDQTMRDTVLIARTIEETYCAAKPDYFPGRSCTEVSNSAKKPTALDMEIKYFTNGEILFKQFRQFSGR